MTLDRLVLACERALLLVINNGTRNPGIGLWLVKEHFCWLITMALDSQVLACERALLLVNNNDTRQAGFGS